MLWMDVDAALSEVPVNLIPLTDSGDFVTIEDSVAYNAAGLALYWHFVTTAGAYTCTQVTPTTGGTYDWAHQGQGMYSIEIPASGGASINNDTEGFGWFTGVATGVLPWRGPTIGFRAAELNNLLIDSAFSTTRGLAGTALPNAAADAAGGLPISDAGGLDLDARLDAAVSSRQPTIWSSASATVSLTGTTVATVTTLTGHTPQTGDSYARIGATGSGLTSLAPAATALSTATWTGTRAGYLDNLSGGAVALASGVNVTQISGSTTAADNVEVVFATDFATNYSTATDKWQVEANVLQIEGSDATDTMESRTRAALGFTDNDLNNRVTALTSELAKVPKSDSNVTWNSTAAAQIQSEVTDALVAHNLDHLCLTATGSADMTSEVADNTILARVLANGDTSAFTPSTDGLQPIRDRGDSAWVTATGFSTLDAAGVRSAVGLASANLDTQLDAMPTAAENAAAILAAGDVDGFSLEETLKLCLAALAGKLSGAEGTTITIRSADDSANRIVATVDSSGNRSSITLNSAG